MYHTRGLTMINLWEYQPEDKICITCIDREIIIGVVTDVQDEEESGFGEDTINVLTPDGKWIGVRNSEITRIEIMK